MAMMRGLMLGIGVVVVLVGAWVMGERHGREGLIHGVYPGQQHARMALYDVEASPVRQWNALALEAIAARQVSPLEASRFLAMLHSAIFNAASVADRRYELYQDTEGILTALDPAEAWDAQALIDGAAMEIFEIFFGEYESLYAQIAQRSEGEQDSLRLGRGIGIDIGRLRWDDGAHIPPAPYRGDDAPGIWRTTPPYYEDGLQPLWGGVTPFVITSLTPYDPGPPPLITSEQYVEELRHVALLGSHDSAVRTREQSEIALFWADGKGTFTPPGHWNAIAASLIAQNDRAMALIDEARLFALLNLALADAGIVTWEAKYRYNYWRPIDAIRGAGSDGNPLTSADPSWHNFIDTPNFPEYPSGHSVFSATGATILSAFFGEESAFTTTSRGLPGAERSFTSLMDAARESGMSRIYGGIHFASADQRGRAIGVQIARDVLASALLPASFPE